jgi:hypothetical protein
MHSGIYCPETDRHNRNEPATSLHQLQPRLAGAGQEEPGAGRGMCWEAHLVYNDLYRVKNSTSKYVPIVFTAADAQHIPPVLHGRTHFCLDTDQGYWQLYRRLTGQPEVEPGNLGFTEKLPRRDLFRLRPPGFLLSDGRIENPVEIG